MNPEIEDAIRLMTRLRRLGLTSLTQVLALLELAKSPLRMTDLAERLKLTVGGAATIVRAMNRIGLIVPRGTQYNADPVKLSPKGIRIANDLAR